MKAVVEPRAMGRGLPFVGDGFWAVKETLRRRWRLRREYSRSSLVDLLVREARDGRPHERDDQAVELGLRVGERLSAVLRLPNTCLFRSIVRFGLWSQAGRTPEFVVGLEPDATALAGHAWIEMNGRPYRGEAVGHYIRTYRFSLPDRGMP